MELKLVVMVCIAAPVKQMLTIFILPYCPCSVKTHTLITSTHARADQS